MKLRELSSELDDIPGIGEVRRKVLLRAFGSLARVRQARFEELAPYVGPKAASQIIEYFNATEAAPAAGPETPEASRRES